MANKTFTEKQREIIARKLGYDGPMEGFEKFVRSSPAMEQKVRQLAVKIMARGGVVKKFAKGGTPIGFFPGATPDIYRSMGNEAMAQKLEIALAAPSTPTPSLQAAPAKAASVGPPAPAAPASTTVGATPSGARITASPTVYASGPSSSSEPPPATKPVTATSTANITVDQLYQSILGRAPDAAGRDFYEKKYGSEIDPSEVADFVSGIGPGESVTKEQAAQKAIDITKQISSVAPSADSTTAQATQTTSGVKEIPPEVLGFSVTGYAPGVQSSYNQALARSIGGRSAYIGDPNTWTMESRGSATVDGIQMVPGAPGWAEQSKDPTIVAKREEILKAEIAPQDPAVRAYLYQNNMWDETAQNAYAKVVTEDAEREALRQAVVANKITGQQAQDIVDGKATMPTSIKTTATTLANNVLGGKASITTVKPGSNLPTTSVPTTTTGTTTGTGTGTGVTRSDFMLTSSQMPGAPTAPTMDVAKIGTPDTEQLIAPPTDITATTATPATAATAAQVTAPTATAAPTVDAVKAKSTVDAAVAGNEAVTGTLSSSAQAAAAETKPAETALKDLEAAKLTSPREVAGVPERTLQAGELVSGSAVNQSLIDAALIKAEAATAAVKPEMTVQGQLDKLLADFDSGNPPPWAASSLRNANAVMASRGLGASSLAGQAIVQATLEAAIPIAAQDAQTVTALELQNLSNRQQVAVLVAQQRAAFLGQEFDQAFQTRVVNAARVADIANLNFTAEQTIALENARLAQTVDLANLSNDQAVIMARAAQVANLESANLSNRQQAALQNAQAFLQLDLTNLNNEQQTSLFNAEKTIQAIFTDTAAENAAKQFNATSTMQVQQFYDSISAQVSQFNASQKNALEQFNVSQENAVEQFNAQQTNAVAQFNAQNRLIVDQSNAEWRRQISTIDTAAQNTANQFDAQAGLQINLAEYNNLWQSTRDTMEYAFKASEGYLDRQNTLAIAVLQKEAAIGAAKFELEAAKYASLGKLSASVFSSSGKDILGTVAGGGQAVIDLLKSLGPSAGPARPTGTGDVEDQPGGFYGESVFTDSAMDFLGDYPMFFEDDAGGAAAGYDYWGGSD